MSTAGHQETEIKIRLRDVSEGRLLLQEAGFLVHVERTYEDNFVFDTADGALRQSGRLLRLRHAGGSALLTYKGPSIPGRHKSREEIETSVGNPNNFQLILENLGYRISFRYQKYRSEYTRRGEPGTVTLDETPIGTFFELEGPPDWIDLTARRFGFSEKDYITASYGSLYLEHRDRNPDAGRDMVFPLPL